MNLAGYCPAAATITEAASSPAQGWKSGTARRLMEFGMAWTYLFVAGVLEVVWAYSMKQSAGFTRLMPSVVTLIAMIASFSLLSISMKTLPLGTAYTVWTGIGAVGAFVVGAVFLAEELSPMRVLAAVLIVSGLVLFRLSATD